MMHIIPYLFAGLVLALLLAFCLALKLRHISRQISLIKEVLEDIREGNLNRRILVQGNDLTKQICYDINQIAVSSQSRLIQQRQAEQAYKRIMTSLSHDVKTPLASLIGYLEAVEAGVADGEEKDEYIHIASVKAQHLEHFVENLFEWVKLDSGEQSFCFELADLNELSRNIMTDWIPVLENNHFVYEITIPEEEYLLPIDVNAYTRIINNLLQNIIIHSGGDKMTLQLFEEQQQIKVRIGDNGKGIAPDKLPHIFERLYQCDDSRSAKGNGLGLSITRELVNAHKGSIAASSTPGQGTEFIIAFPKAL